VRKVLIVMGRYLPGYKDGGPVQSIKNLTDRLGDSYEFRIITTDRDHGDERPYDGIRHDEWNRVGKAKVWYVYPGGFSRAIIEKLASEVDVVYLCGCFNDYARTVMQLKKQNRIKVSMVIAPMGLFSPGAMRIRCGKKKLYLTLCKVLGWFRGVTFSVTSEEEKKDVLREIGNGARCIIAKDLPRLEICEETALEKDSGKLRVVFFSRISPKKNLEYALQVVKRLSGEVTFDIYGICEDEAYFNVCKSLMQDMPAGVNCSYRGPLWPAQVKDVLSKYHVLLFPTLGENYGHVIYEAMMSGCIPVLSDTTPWDDVHGTVGVALPLEDDDAFVFHLERIKAMTNAEYQKHRKSVYQYISEYQERIDTIGYEEILNL